MNSFKTNKIFLDSETVAEQLRSARQASGVKLEKVAKELGINIKYLEALEKGNFSSLPAGVYGKNFLREYAIYLRLDYRPLLKMFENEVSGNNNQQQELFSKQVVKAHYFITVPRIIKNALILLAVVICLSFLSFRLEKIIAPPELKIINPTDNLITTDQSIFIEGWVEPETQLSINGENTVIDGQGNFNKLVQLKKGINIITINAQKKYGRSTIEKRQILVEN